ncbi:MAG: polymer-forming cytoskeletal protein [Tannerellaceae bacterium]|nr:polymer-forming cytoskeletal protein [Tannerellaceae bacterium]
MGLKNREDASPGGLHNTLAAGSTIKGDVVTDGDFRLDGHVEGNIQCAGKLVIGPKASIQGNVNSGNAEILGTVVGDIHTAGVLVLKATAVIQGDIYTPTLEIEPNAKFTGACDMSGNNKNG